MNATIEKSLRVFNDKEGVSVFVRVSADGPEFGIEVVVTDKKSAEWFGPVNLRLSDKDHARAVGKAIMEMAEEIEE